MHLSWLPVWYSTLSESGQEAFLYALRVTPIKMWYNINVSRERRHGEKVKKKLTQFEKFELAEQARQARDAEWEVKVKELKDRVYVDSLIIVAKNAHIESQKKQIKVLELLTND